MSKRRRLADIETDDNIPAKKSKTEGANIVFSNNEDQRQFQMILKSINECELVKKLHVPLAIDSEIAQYATGEYYKCSERGCKEEINFLRETYDQDKNKKFIVILVDDEYKCYCGSCMMVECDQCEKELKRQKISCYKNEYCMGCDTYLCRKCGRCLDCKRRLCPSTADRCDNENCDGWVCDNCLSSHNCGQFTPEYY